MANLIPEICKMLSVELGEEFKVKGREYIFHFVDNGLIAYRTDGSVLPYENCLAHFLRLINGEEEIVKLPWKPKADDKYWTFALRYNNAAPDKRTWRIVPSIWTEHPSDWALLDKGWVYKTKGEAIKALPTVAREAGVEYELPTSDTEAVEQWKPRMNERYWTFMSSLEGGKLYVLNYMWDNSVIDVALHKVGWAFRTCEEAQAALPAVAKELDVEYEL